MTKYYEVFFDAEGFPDRWHLDEPSGQTGEALDANLFPKKGPYAGPKIVKVQIDTRYPGKPLDFSFGYFSFIMVKSWVADMIQSHGGNIQRFPVVLGPTGEAGYEVIFTLDAPRGVIDLSRAEEIEYYEESDTEIDQRYGGIAPRQKGMLYRLSPLFIDAEKAAGLEFFRPWERNSLIVSESLKSAFENAGVTGIAYRLAS
jgi:hypothetical protein